MKGCAVALALGLAAAAASAGEGWFPSRYGEDDTLGAANNLSPEGVLRAAKLVKTGQVYSLGVTTGHDTPAYPPRSYQIVTIPTAAPNQTLGSNKAVAHDDLLITWMGIGSQLDGLGHLGIDHRYYNGVHEDDLLRPNGLLKLSTDRIPPIVTRGVLLDIAALRGVAMLAAGTAINRPEIDAACARQGVSIGKGDVVLLHTGYQAMAAKDAAAFLAGEPGLGKGGAEHLASLGAVAVGADSWAVEVIPFEDPKEAFPVHQILLAKNGVYILENMDTAALAADRAFEFLFVLGQPKFQGAVQAIVNPIAIR
jgi:kynurenine formamidase